MTADTSTHDQTSQSEHEFADALHDSTRFDGQMSALDVLRELDPGAKISVRRLSPNYAKGYLGLMTVGPSGIMDLEEELMANFGGGVFRLQGREIGGGEGEPSKPGFGRGCAIVEIAGDPIKDGRRYLNGMLEQAQATPQVVPQYMPAPAQSGGRGGLESAMLGIVQTTLQRATSGDGSGVDLAGLGALITSLGAVMGGRSEQSDPMATLERAFGMVGKIQKMSAPTDGGSSEDDGFGGMFAGGGALQNVLMQKILGGSQPPQQPQYPPQYPPQQGPTWQSHPNYGPPQQQQHQQPPNWTPQPNGVPYSQAPHAHAPPHVQPEAPQEPQSQHEEPDDPPSEGSGEGPFTVANLEAELEDMQPEERQAFMAEVMQKLGIDSAIGQNIKANMAGGPEAPPVPPAPNPPTNTSKGTFPSPFNMGAAFDK